MEVLEPTQDLTRERLRDFLVEAAMLAKTARNRTTRNILQEAAHTRQTTGQSASAEVLTC